MTNNKSVRIQIWLACGLIPNELLDLLITLLNQLISTTNALQIHNHYRQNLVLEDTFNLVVVLEEIFNKSR